MKTHKNRLHFEFDADDQTAEVQRLLALGASHVDVGQRDVGWVVLADPEGSEAAFRSRDGLGRLSADEGVVGLSSSAISLALCQ